MKKILLVGSVACGKTTLCQRINGMEQVYKKTQALEVINQTIDTPGEYLEHRSLLRALVVTAVDVEQVLFVLDPTQSRYMFSPGQAAAFPVPVAGVITVGKAAGTGQGVAGTGRCFSRFYGQFLYRSWNTCIDGVFV